MEFVYCSVFGIRSLGMDLDCCDSEWLALKTNWYHSVILEITLKYCILDYEGYSISSKGFLPKAVERILSELNLPIPIPVHFISTGEGNGKSLQYSCLENPMNSMKRQNDKILKEELPRSVDAQYPLEISGEITPERMKTWSQSKTNTQLWMWLVMEARSDAVKSNIA